jgi:hypothetical protein
LARDRSTFSVGGVPFATADTAVFGAVAGGQAGYNWQSGALVLGVEGDFDWSNPKGSISAQCATCLTVTNASLEHDIDWFGTARARIGYGTDGWLAYATGGYAFESAHRALIGPQRARPECEIGVAQHGNREVPRCIFCLARRAQRTEQKRRQITQRPHAKASDRDERHHPASLIPAQAGIQMK